LNIDFNSKIVHPDISGFIDDPEDKHKFNIDSMKNLFKKHFNLD